MKSTLITLALIACVVAITAKFVGIPHPIPAERIKPAKTTEQQIKWKRWSETM